MVKQYTATIMNTGVNYTAVMTKLTRQIAYTCHLCWSFVPRMYPLYPAKKVDAHTKKIETIDNITNWLDSSLNIKMLCCVETLHCAETRFGSFELR